MRMALSKMFLNTAWSTTAWDQTWSSFEALHNQQQSEGNHGLHIKVSMSHISIHAAYDY